MRQEERLVRRREKDGLTSNQRERPSRRPRDPMDEEVETNIREYMARTGPRGERLTRSQQERLLKQELRGLGTQLEKLEKKAKADEATQDLPELDDHTLEELYQALMLPPPPTEEEMRLARLEGGRREKGLVDDGRGRRGVELLGRGGIILESRAEERRRRAGMDLKQRMIDARERGKMLLPPSSSSLPRMQEVTMEAAAERSAAVDEEEPDLAALPYAERQEIRLQQLFARLALVHSTPDTDSNASTNRDEESLQGIKSNLADRIARILQEHDYELQSTAPRPMQASPSDVAEDNDATLPQTFVPVRLDGRAPTLSDAQDDQTAIQSQKNYDVETGGDLATRAEAMIKDLGSAESREFMLSSIDKLVRSASPAVPSSSSTAASLPLGVATIEEWTALAVASARADDTATLSRTMSLMHAAGYHPAPLSLYNHVMDVFASKGQVDMCQEWLSKMSEVGLVPDDHTYHSLAKAYVNTCQFMPAIQLLNSLESNGTPASMATYTLVIDRLLDPIVLPQTGAKQERPELQALAWNVFYHMRLHAHPIPDAPLYTLMIRACARGVPQPQDVDDPSSTYTGLDLNSRSPSSTSSVDATSRTSDAERALDLFREMTTRYSVRPNAEVYNALILACARRKDFYLEAFRLLREMVELETERSNVDLRKNGMLRFAPDRYTFNALLQGCARNRDLARARWVLAEMIRTTLPLFDAEVREGLGREERVELLSKRPNEETMCHVFHTYAAYTPPIKRDQMGMQGQTKGSTPDNADSENGANTAELVSRAEETSLSPTAEMEDDSTTPEEAAHIFSSLVPQTSSDLVSETRSLFARILADQPASSSTEGPLGSVAFGVRLVNSYFTVLAAHLPPNQRASVLHSALVGRADGSSSAEGTFEHALFDKLGLEANEHSYRIVLESLSDADSQQVKLVDDVWTRFRNFLSSQASRAESTALTTVSQHTRYAEPIDAAQLTKCWSAYIHYHAKHADGLDKAMLVLREFVSLYPPALPSDVAGGMTSGKKKSLRKTRLRQMALLREKSAEVKLDLSPLPVAWKSLQSLIALTGAGASTGANGRKNGLQAEGSTPSSVEAVEAERGSEVRLSEPPSLTFLDVQLLHHRLVRYGRTKDLAYLSWVLHRYAAAGRARRHA
ncbi:hypothetical protein PHSY_004745 [Pseudozyma hubeiensis SY62]|uniref:Pentatricopeptide repeat protein n=1 Tax=Pseudozyma hubeiensis (strain SY62) TaxID=1305764 RepID=R9PGC3_PSEHS|nr:hypothetical protein PHSY_004745 [Pseudozyma hubeiensis SY62]GAC97160.1 hypothetical protein PHSY_004745 [Pseudozyma hubeiensis SY62]